MGNVNFFQFSFPYSDEHRDIVGDSENLTSVFGLQQSRPKSPGGGWPPSLAIRQAWVTWSGTPGPAPPGRPHAGRLGRKCVGPTAEGERAEPEGSALLFSPLIQRGFCINVGSCLELASFCWCFLGLLRNTAQTNWGGLSSLP